MAAHNLQVVKISTEETYALRTAVLRADTPTSDPKYAEDSKPGTVHLGIFDENKNLTATSTWVINPWQDDLSAIAIQLRGMAVATKHQKSGLGKLLLDAGLTVFVNFTWPLASVSSQLLISDRITVSIAPWVTSR